MRTVFLAALLCAIGFIAIAWQTNAQSIMPSTIEGRVIDAETGEPLRGAHVFLSGTRIGTVTNPSGRFRLHRVPPGSHRLTVSIIGYERTPMEIVLRAGENKVVDKELKTVVYQMDEIYAGDLDRRWRRHVRRFERLFLGESAMADSVEILNPEVLRFESRWWGRFTAEALTALEIENRALGYRITYYLDEFYHSGLRTRWTGDHHFTEMVPADSAQAAYWKENRKKAFEGSLRHFFLALSNHSLTQEGFMVYPSRRDIHGNYQRSTFRLNPSQIIQEAGDDHFYYMNFSGRIVIIYTRQGEDIRYPRWNGDFTRGAANIQTSYLQLNKRPVTIDPKGEIVETYGATRFGYYSFQRVGDETPRDYRPESADILHFMDEKFRAENK